MILREVVSSDAELLFKWSNDPAIRSVAFSSGPIEWQGHLTWLESRLGDSRTRFFLALRDSEPVGQIRFEIRDDVAAEVHVNTKPGLQGMGIGSQLIALGLARLREASAVKTVHAMIRSENVRSLRTFRRLGFVEAGREFVQGKECFHLVRELP